MPFKTTAFSFFKLYEKFIRDSRKGRRLQPNGKKISAGTVDNYRYTLLLLQRFFSQFFELRIHPSRRFRPGNL